MSANKFTDEFKRDEVAQVEDRGYPVREVAERLGVSTKSIYTWQTYPFTPSRTLIRSRYASTPDHGKHLASRRRQIHSTEPLR